MRNILHYCWLIGLFLINSIVPASLAAGTDSAFLQAEGAHFIVQYTSVSDRQTVNSILNNAETYYDRISRDIGYSWYQNFWTWEKRVNIVLYPDKTSYVKFTGQPEWSKGYASRDSKLFRTHTIVSFDGQEDFLSEVLPHEIAHLMMWDYLGFTRRVPIWFEEGVAQLEEEGKRSVVQQAMAGVVAAGNEIPFSSFADLNITSSKDTVSVSVYYAQSLSIVDYMIGRFGQAAFHKFCKNIRDGREFEEAMRLAYPSIFESLKDLERKWKKYLQEIISPTGGLI